MTCYAPRPAFRLEDGSVSLREAGAIASEFRVPCGACIGCRLDRARHWSLRCSHEASLYDANSFVTLTYDDEHLPPDWSLRYEDFQLFMKRLRKRAAARFFMCGEYGDVNSRPHYHAILFGVAFLDRYYWRTSESGFRCYRSPVLDELWPLGFAEIGSVTPASASYIAKYGLKCRAGKWMRTPSGRIDAETGEVFPRVPEFLRCSLKPGIGARWFELYGEKASRDDVVPTADGKEVGLPRYYDKLIERCDPERLRQLKIDRQEAAKDIDDSESRLRAGEKIARRRTRSKEL